ncbi:hypothetical protein M407DRAFT_71786 [Tulasnella calospora MUT 4182]|uniref:Uncharacterized protein n=1 Tax=Tulasnella calospora MUT 4182 TaxID=1051891 RepID=A0A0C3L3Y7_9AGAM|nr:hypothetical protein M407DRAFT_71786 [Tulasnella calospora MUT 4182]
MVNRSARVSGAAGGGQIMISNDVVREIFTILPMDESETGLLASLDTQPPTDGNGNPTAAALHRLGVVIKEMGEFRLKGLEVPETLSLVYPKELTGRLKLETKNVTSNATTTRVQFSLERLRSLVLLAIRIEALASHRVFRPTAMMHRSYSIQSASGAAGSTDDIDPDIFMYANPEFLLPPIHGSATDAELLQVMDSLTLRISKALLIM